MPSNYHDYEPSQTVLGHFNYYQELKNLSYYPTDESKPAQTSLIRNCICVIV